MRIRDAVICAASRLRVHMFLTDAGEAEESSREVCGQSEELCGETEEPCAAAEEISGQAGAERLMPMPMQTC